YKTSSDKLVLKRLAGWFVKCDFGTTLITTEMGLAMNSGDGQDHQVCTILHDDGSVSWLVSLCVIFLT
ncbi:hypothetical protein BON22_5017, partial [Cyberlindnera fabianii]